MLTRCLKRKKKIENMNSKVLKTKNGRSMLLIKFAICDSKKPRFVKEQEAKRLLSSLVIKTSLSNIPLLVNILVS